MALFVKASTPRVQAVARLSCRAGTREKSNSVSRSLPNSSTSTPHFHATVTVPTALWNDKYHHWVYNGKNSIKVGTALIIRGAQHVKDNVKCWPIVEGTKYGGYYVPVAHVRLGAQIP